MNNLSTGLNKLARGRNQIKPLNLKYICLLAILIEGYVVLASEIISIRLLVAFVGSDTPIIAIIISAVLLPLAFGYYYGGQLYKKLSKRSGAVPIRAILIKNATIASLFLTFGLSYIFLKIFFGLLYIIGIESRILQTAIYSVIFLVTPVYLLAQTTPLISNYFSKQSLSETAGKMLFSSTIGSFLGATLTSLFLMHYVGVNNTVIITIFALAFFIFVLNKRYFSYENFVVSTICILVFILNNSKTLEDRGVISNNQYSIITINNVKEEKDFNSRIMNINNSESSKFTTNPGKRFEYLKYIDSYYIKELPKDKISKILVIGAGGFTIGLDDTRNNYTYVDIDGALLEVSEKHFLKQKLTDNKKFVAEPARTFLKRNKIKYDMIIIDVYSNKTNLPYQLVTKEYFQQVKDNLNKNGIVIANIIAKHNFSDDWSIKIDNTIRSVFSYISRVSVHRRGPWKDADTNIVYTCFKNRNNSNNIYTDNKNDYFFDK